jgi:hypothetical protein
VIEAGLGQVELDFFSLAWERFWRNGPTKSNASLIDVQAIAINPEG